MEIESHELVQVTVFRRDLTEMLGKLRTGGVDKIVLTKNGQPQCVIVTPDEYDRLRGRNGSG